jgi:glucose-1-phosphatase
VVLLDKPEIDLVLFDLGGVLIRLGGGVDAMKRLAAIETAEEVWRRWLSCEWVRSFERGTCSPGEFASGVVDDWGLSISPTAFLEQFRGWPEDLYDGARELLEKTRRTVPIGCLSNTNALHWADHSAKWALDGYFDHRFLSYEVGLVKPDREIFEHVCMRLDLRPERIVFLDDNALNIDQACALGFQAYRVRGPGEAREALEELGIVRVR